MASLQMAITPPLARRPMNLEPERELISRLEPSQQEPEKPALHRTPMCARKGKDLVSRLDCLGCSLVRLPTVRMMIAPEKKDLAGRQECSRRRRELAQQPMGALAEMALENAPTQIRPELLFPA